MQSDVILALISLASSLAGLALVCIGMCQQARYIARNNAFGRDEMLLILYGLYLMGVSALFIL